jgi:hypothetical protein
MSSPFKDVTFESLDALKKELNEWFGDEGNGEPAKSASFSSRDMLVSILIHSLAEELSDVRVRSQIQALLAEFSQKRRPHFAD